MHWLVVREMASKIVNFETVMNIEKAVLRMNAGNSNRLINTKTAKSHIECKEHAHKKENKAIICPPGAFYVVCNKQAY